MNLVEEMNDKEEQEEKEYHSVQSSVSTQTVMNTQYLNHIYDTQKEILEMLQSYDFVPKDISDE